MKIQLIDNNHYFLTAKQAKSLSIEGRLPRDGYEIKADPAKLARLELMDGDTKAISLPESGWILKTPLHWWEGKDVEAGWVWCVRIQWNEKRIGG